MQVGILYDSATQALKELHWLPIKFRIIHKILTLSLKGSAPKYLQELLIKSTAEKIKI